MEQVFELITYLLAIFVLVAIVLLVVRGVAGRRQRLLTRILDLADELEALLKQTKTKMDAMQQVVKRVPADIGAVADASLQSQDQIQQGLRNVLEHRLWLAKHAESAGLQDLRESRAALERSRASIAEQLRRLESAGAELTEVTDAALEQARREPAALRRASNDSGGES